MKLHHRLLAACVMTLLTIAVPASAQTRKDSVVLAMVLQRWVIIVSTSFSGSWTMIVGALAIAGSTAAQRAAASGNVWILYPFTPATGGPWVVAIWFALGLMGLFVQAGFTGRKKF